VVSSPCGTGARPGARAGRGAELQVGAQWQNPKTQPGGRGLAMCGRVPGSSARVLRRRKSSPLQQNRL